MVKISSTAETKAKSTPSARSGDYTCLGEYCQHRINEHDGHFCKGVPKYAKGKAGVLVYNVVRWRSCWAVVDEYGRFRASADTEAEGLAEIEYMEREYFSD